MKKVFYKAIFLMTATAFVSAFGGTASKACGNSFGKCCLRQNPPVQKQGGIAETEHMDFILTNSILRF